MKDKLNNKEYIVFGNTYKAKPLKLQLNRDAYNYIRNLSQYIKTETELTDIEMKDPAYSFIISLAIAGFISNEEYCIDTLTLFIEEGEDWTKIISQNKDKFEDFKMVAMNILNDFFLNVRKLTQGSEH